MTTPHIAKEDVLVIGAGPAGIASAVALQRAGISYKVVDRAHTIASTWDSLYPSLKLNTTRFYSHQDGMRFPLSFGMFPSAKQYHSYLLRYVDKHALNIHLGITVEDVAPEGTMWRVTTSQGTLRYKAVISATGIYGNPVTPHIDGMEGFRGRILHAHDYQHPHQVTGQRVLVVGTGPSGVDIAVASAKTAQKVYLGVRSGVTMQRRYPYGLPKQAWLMLFAVLPQAWCNRLMKLTNLGYPDAQKYGLTPPEGKQALTAYQGRELLDAVKAGGVHPVPAPVRFCEHSVILADDRELAVDTVVMATGYTPVLHHYLHIPMQYSTQDWESPPACDWQIGANGQRGFPMLDRSTHPNGREVLGYRGLYIVGVHYKGKGAMYNFNIEARIATQQIKAQLARS